MTACLYAAILIAEYHADPDYSLAACVSRAVRESDGRALTANLRAGVYLSIPIAIVGWLAHAALVLGGVR